jgi:hypothetical protein
MLKRAKVNAKFQVLFAEVASAMDRPRQTVFRNPDITDIMT